VREDGAIEHHAGWPRPILASLPFGEAGIVAWNNGTDRWPETGPGYVMYRTAPDAAVTICELPFAPNLGAWWRGRLFWACYPTGLAAWAPGGDPELLVPDLAVLAVHPGHEYLRLDPCLRAGDGALVRHLATEGWRWRPGDPPATFALDEWGAVSARAATREWTAIVYPEADLVRIENTDGRAWSLVCPHPLSAAWAGGSLVVASADGCLFFFEHLAVTLERSWD
jgi:hypothetical protein